MPTLFTGGNAAIIQVSGYLDFDTYRDDTGTNLMPNYGILQILGAATDTGDLKVTLANGQVETITGQEIQWYNSQNFLVKKVWDTATSFTSANIRVYS